MALLHLLRLRADLKVCAAHFEHGLRGEESLRDAAFVEDYCRREGIPCLVEHGDVRAFARENGLGIEEAARELRYAFLERAADALGCDTIATAHNADDNAETLLLHLLRGSGLSRRGGGGSCARCWTPIAPRSSATLSKTASRMSRMAAMPGMSTAETVCATRSCPCCGSSTPG